MNAVREFTEALNSVKPQSVLNFETEFRHLMKSFDVQAVVANQLRNCLSDFRSPPPIVYESTLQLVSGDWFSIELAINHSTSYNTVAFTHADAISAFLTEANYKRFALRNFEKNTFSLDARLELKHQGNLTPGEIIVIDSRSDVVSLQHDKPMAYVSLSEKFHNGIVWRFDTQTGRPISHFSSSPITTVLELMSKFLGIYGDMENISALQSLLVNQSDSVKWSAATAISHIDKQQGVRAFNLLKNCKSPLIAKAARETLLLN